MLQHDSVLCQFVAVERGRTLFVVKFPVSTGAAPPSVNCRRARERRYGIRGQEKYYFLLWGLAFSAAVYCLGVWQLKRMRWKRDLIERRRARLNDAPLIVRGGASASRRGKQNLNISVNKPYTNS